MENTTDTQLTPFEQTKQEAREKIASMTLEDIAGYIALTKTRVSELETSNKEIRYRLQELVDSVTEFIKNNYQSGASSDDLKELADELEIELTTHETNGNIKRQEQPVQRERSMTIDVQGDQHRGDKD